MGILPWKKPSDASKPAEESAGGGGSDEPIHSPERASKFFERARTVHETGNHEYATQLWLSGLRFEPGNMPGMEGLFQSIAMFLSETGGKKSMSKDVAKAVGGRSEVDKYLTTLLEWGFKPRDATLAVRAMESASKLKLMDATNFIGTRAMNLALAGKPSKSMLVKIAESFERAGAFEKAAAAVDQAYKLDPSDGELSARSRSLAAQATMSRGGFDQTGTGGFRANIRDAAKQQKLQEEEQIGKTEETLDRVIANAKAELQQRPDDVPTIEKLARFLLDRRRPQDEEDAHRLYTKASDISKQFRFKELAGDIRIRQAARKTAELKAMLDKAPGDEMIGRMHAQYLQQQLELEVSEYEARSKQYPTDLARKFELAKRYFALDRYQDALGLLQEAQEDPRNRAQAKSLLGQCFLKISFYDEAVQTFREALDVRDASPELSLELQYSLMAALEAKARESRELQHAEEAEKIASAIAVKSVSYRDILDRRIAIKKLVAELRGAKPA